jgi:hypothetical protein
LKKNSTEEIPDRSLFVIQTQQAQNQGFLMFIEEIRAEMVNESGYVMDEPGSEHTEENHLIVFPKHP